MPLSIISATLAAAAPPPPCLPPWTAEVGTLNALATKEKWSGFFFKYPQDMAIVGSVNFTVGSSHIHHIDLNCCAERARGELLEPSGSCSLCGLFFCSQLWVMASADDQRRVGMWRASILQTELELSSTHDERYGSTD